LIDDTVYMAGLKAEHGLSFWIEHGNKKILFDTGQSDMLIQNAKTLDINLAEADAIVISHGHYDHTGGLEAVLNIASKAILYLHPEALKSKFSPKNNKIGMIGTPDSAKEIIHILADKKRVVWTEIPTEVSAGLFVTGRIPRNTDFEDNESSFFIDNSCQKVDTLPDDQAMFFDSPKGLIVLLGCAHSGVVNTLHYVAKLSGEKCIYAIIGGMHLLNASQERMAKTIEALKKYDIQKIVPLHCTGQEAAGKIKKVFGEKCISSGAGAKIVF
jgi:7,8-dihydropterin-6-yl-methyl-4-(beta-D-ribofuranosyl)aminobenzene 5'-phosphate synthase